MRRTSWSGVARGRGSHGDAESYPLWSIPGRRLRDLEGSVTYRGFGPGRRAEGPEVLDFPGATGDVVLDTTKPEAAHDVAATPRPASKMAYIVVIWFWTRAPGFRAEGHGSCLFPSTSVPLSCPGVGTGKFGRVL